MIPGGYFKPNQQAPQPEPELPPEEPVIEEDIVDQSGGFTVPPDAVSYHTGEENCGACEYMGPDGTCGPLQIQVSPADHCNLFEMREGGTGEEMPVEGEYAKQS